MHKKIFMNFANETQTGRDGLPVYRRKRPENERFQTFSKTGSVGAGPDDQFIAPCCCLQLPRLLNELINVEHVVW